MSGILELHVELRSVGRLTDEEARGIRTTLEREAELLGARLVRNRLELKRREQESAERRRKVPK